MKSKSVLIRNFYRDNFVSTELAARMAKAIKVLHPFRYVSLVHKDIIKESIWEHTYDSGRDALTDTIEFESHKPISLN